MLLLQLAELVSGLQLLQPRSVSYCGRGAETQVELGLDTNEHPTLAQQRNPKRVSCSLNIRALPRLRLSRTERQFEALAELLITWCRLRLRDDSASKRPLMLFRLSFECKWADLPVASLSKLSTSSSLPKTKKSTLGSRCDVSCQKELGGRAKIFREGCHDSCFCGWGLKIP